MYALNILQFSQFFFNNVEKIKVMYSVYKYF